MPLGYAIIGLATPSSFSFLGFVKNSILIDAGNVKSPVLLLILTNPDERISVNSGINVYLALANSSNITALLCIRGIKPGLIWLELPAFTEPPIKPAGVAALPAKDAIAPTL